VTKKFWLIIVLVIYAVYFFAAARPIPPETVLVPGWLSSLETGNSVQIDSGIEYPPSNIVKAGTKLIPFSFGSRFGYFDTGGNFSINQIRTAGISISADLWAEYEAEPDKIEIRGNNNEYFAVIENPRGYPFFLNGRIFLFGSEQNAISEINDSGSVIWTYDFTSPVTSVDATAELLVAGLLDGYVEVINREGNRVFSFAPGGSRYAVILGLAISSDGSRIGIISGIENQRFLLLERFGTGRISFRGNTSGIDGSIGYRVVYHEFLDTGYRRPVFIEFVENDQWIVFEHNRGLGLYEIGSKKSNKVELGGEIYTLDKTGGKGLVFVIISGSANQKELIGIRLPGRIAFRAPFTSREVFLGRDESGLFVGSAQVLVSFELDKR